MTDLPAGFVLDNAPSALPSGFVVGQPQQPARPPGLLGTLDDAVRSIANGATFGFADELAAKADALLGHGTYEKNVAQQRARDQSISPWVSVPGQVTGGVLTGVLAAPVAGEAAAVTGLEKLPWLLKAAGTGAGVGALYGAGNADNNRLQGAEQGAVTGAVLGPVGAAVGRGVLNAVKPASRAGYDLARALVRDSDTPEAIAARATAAQATRPETTLADVGGENTRGLVEGIANRPGAGRAKVVGLLTARQQDQADRIANDLGKLTGSSQTARQAIDASMAQRAKDAAPLYSAAYDAGDKAIWSPELERLSATPEVQQAMRSAVNGWQRAQVANGYGAMNPGALVDNGQLKFLQGKVPVFPNLQFWDYTKNSLDDMIASEIKPDGTLTRKGRDLTMIVRKLRNDLDNQVPEYAAARAAWGGPSSYIHAVEDGKKAMQGGVSAEQMQSMFKGLTDAEKEGFRIGAVSAIRDAMERNPNQTADMTRYIRSQAMQKKMATLMPNEASARKWANAVDWETKSSDLTRRSLTGSPTARRLAEQQDANAFPVEMLIDALHGAPTASIWRTVMTAGTNRVRDTLRSRVDKRLADILLNVAITRNPQTMQEIARRTGGLLGPGATPGLLGTMAGGSGVARGQ